MQVTYAVDNEWSHKLSMYRNSKRNEFSEIGQRSWKQNSEWLARECCKRYVFAGTSQMIVSPWPVPHLIECVYKMEDSLGGRKEKETRQELFYSLVYTGIFLKNIWNWESI